MRKTGIDDGFAELAKDIATDPSTSLGMTKGLWTISFIIRMMNFHARNG